MDIIQGFIERAKRRNQRLVLPEGNDERIIQAARRMLDDGLARPVLLGKAEAALADREDVKNALTVHDYFASVPDGVGLCVCNTDGPCEAVGEVLEELGEVFKYVQIGVVEDVDPVPDRERRVGVE